VVCLSIFYKQKNFLTFVFYSETRILTDVQLRYVFYYRQKRILVAQHIINYLSQIIPAQQSWKVQLLQKWPTIIGNLKDKVKLHKITDTYVVLSVTHPSLAQELFLLSEMLCEKINTTIGSNRIKSLHFRSTGETRAGATTYKSHKKNRFLPYSGPTPRLTREEQKVLQTITNKELRQALFQFYLTVKKRRVR